MASSPTVVLVHGAFADASGYAGVIRQLQSQGVEVRAPMNPCAASPLTRMPSLGIRRPSTGPLSSSATLTAAP